MRRATVRRLINVSDHEQLSDAAAAPAAGSVGDRQQPRYSVDVTVTVNSDAYFLAGAATNLSSGGVFIATPIVHDVGTEFDISLHIGDGQDGVIHACGEVRWQRPASDDPSLPQGLGIQFLAIEGDGAERIERFLAANREPE